MDDMAEKIASMLNDPESMEGIKAMAQQFMSANNKSEKPDERHVRPESAVRHERHVRPESTVRPESSVRQDSSMPSADDLSGIMNLLGAFKNTETDERSALLLALKPHLSDKRKERVDGAVKIMKLVKLLPVINETGILKGIL